MKRKFISILLITTLTLTGCNSSNPEDNTHSETITNEDNSNTTEEVGEQEKNESPQKKSDENTADNTADNTEADIESIGDIDVDQNLFDVELTIPAEYVGDTTQDELTKQAEESGFKSIILNDDGSATYTMTKKQHKKMMDEMSENINNDLEELIGSEDYPNFTKIETNNDFTSFTITTSSTELGLSESFLTLQLVMYGGLYHVFNGTKVENIHVEFINADSGEMIYNYDSSDPNNNSDPTENLKS